VYKEVVNKTGDVPKKGSVLYQCTL